MGLSVIHYQYKKSNKVVCGMNHFFSTNNIGGLLTTDKKEEVTCKKCLATMHKWGWFNNHTQED